MSVERPPNAGQVNYKHWAERLNDYLIRTRSHLAHYIAGSTAYREGMLVWDDDNKTILYSGNGQWNTIGNGVAGADGTDGTDGTGFTGGFYTPANGTVTFTSNDGLGFTTGDLRGADGIANYPDVTALYYNGNVKAQATTDGVKVTGDVEATEFIGDLRGAVVFKAQAGEALTKGDVVYISGISGNTTVVSKADADDAAKMPAFGLAATDANNNANLEVYTFGTLSGLDTSSYTEGDELFVGTTAGALVSTAPTGEGSSVQKIGKVTRSHASAGSVKIMGAGRTNATPNLNDGNIFIGDSNNQAVTASLATQVSTLETSHDDVLQDGDFASEGLMKRDATSGSYSIVTDNSGDWNTAHGWGNHADAGYLTSFTEANDLSTTVTWANVPDANITESSVTQYLTATNVANAGALMDSEVTNLAQVKAFDSSDYATATQGSTADSALQNLVEDTTPQLGGNLDLNSNNITGSGNISATQLTVGVNGISSTGGITASGSNIYGGTLQSAGNTIVGGNVVVTGTVDGVDIATLGANAIVDGDFTSNGFMKRTGAGTYTVDTSTYATETYVDTAVSNLVDSAPATLDTLNELASALGDDANFSTTVTNSIGTKWTEDATKINNWDTAYSWGNHGDANYLTSFDITTQTDPKYLRADADDTTTGTITAAGLSTSGNVVSASTCQGSLLVSTGNANVAGNLTVIGDYSTSNGNINLPNGSITLGGTVDGVDIATRDGILTTTTATANSAMQNLVDDTTPQLGGHLDLNGSNITGSGNISCSAFITSTGNFSSSTGGFGTTSGSFATTSGNFTTSTGDFETASGNITVGGKVTSNLLEGSQYTNSNLNFYDTATQGGDGTTLSSTAGLSFKYDTNNNDTDGFKVFANGSNTACFTVDNIENVVATGSITANNGFITSSGNYSATTGNITTVTGGIVTTSGDIQATFGNITTGGNISVTGTVDGRDVATDGARLDTIPYHKMRHVKLRGTNLLSLTTSHQNIGNADRIRHPSTPVDCSRYLDLDISIRWNYVSSAVNDLQLQVQLLVPSGGGTVTNMGTVTKGTFSGYSAPSYWSWYYVSGDYTHLFTQFGRINTTGTSNSSEGVLDAWSYNSLTDRTYFLSYNNPGVSFNTGDTIYWSPYAFESAGTLLTITRDIDERYQSNSFQPHHLRFKMAYDDARLEYFVKMKEVSTSDSANISTTTATLTDIEEV